MSEASNAVSGLRDLIQDLITPDIRMLKVQLDHLDKKVTALSELLDKRADALSDELKQQTSSVNNLSLEMKLGILQIAQRLDAFREVQELKVQIARLEAGTKPAV